MVPSSPAAPPRLRAEPPAVAAGAPCSPAEIAAKRENAKGIKDVRRLLSTAEDPDEQAILGECLQRLQAKAKGRLHPKERLEAALVGMADANARLTRAQRHLDEAQNLHLRATEAVDAATRELDAAERADEELRRQEAEEEDRRRLEAEAVSTTVSSTPTLANTMELRSSLQTLQGHLAGVTPDQDGQVRVDPQQLAVILERLVGLVGPPPAAAVVAAEVPSDADSDMGFTDEQLGASLRRASSSPLAQGAIRRRVRGKGGKQRTARGR